jgi:hypothetical protein
VQISEVISQLQSISLAIILGIIVVVLVFMFLIALSFLCLYVWGGIRSIIRSIKIARKEERNEKIRAEKEGSR